MEEYGVIGFVEDLGHPDIDPDPDFRRVLRLLDGLDGVRTVSSCQGHWPREQYEDVDEVMPPYVTVYGPGASRVAASVSAAPHFAGRSGDGPKVCLKFGESVIGRWAEVAAWLEAR